MKLLLLLLAFTFASVNCAPTDKRQDDFQDYEAATEPPKSGRRRVTPSPYKGPTNVDKSTNDVPYQGKPEPQSAGGSTGQNTNTRGNSRHQQPCKRGFRSRLKELWDDFNAPDQSSSGSRSDGSASMTENTNPCADGGGSQSGGRSTEDSVQSGGDSSSGVRGHLRDLWSTFVTGGSGAKGHCKSMYDRAANALQAYMSSGSSQNHAGICRALKAGLDCSVGQDVTQLQSGGGFTDKVFDFLKQRVGIQSSSTSGSCSSILTQEIVGRIL